MVSSSIVYTCDVCGEKSAQEMPEVRFEFEPLEYNLLIGATEFMHVCVVHNIYAISRVIFGSFISSITK